MTCYIASTLLREHWWPGTHCATPAGIPVDWPAHIAGRPYRDTCCMQHCGRSDSDMQQTSSPKILPMPQGPEHPGHWHSCQARAGMGLKLKEEANKIKGRVN